MIRGALLVIVSIVGFVFCLKHGLIDRHFDATHGRWSRPAMDGPEAVLNGIVGAGICVVSLVIGVLWIKRAREHPYD